MASQMIVAVPMVGLYILSIGIAWAVREEETQTIVGKIGR